MTIQCKNHKELGWEDKNCPTCKSLTYHDSIYHGLSSDESMLLFMQRTAEAFGTGIRKSRRYKQLMKGGELKCMHI